MGGGGDFLSRAFSRGRGGGGAFFSPIDFALEQSGSRYQQIRVIESTIDFETHPPDGAINDESSLTDPNVPLYK